GAWALIDAPDIVQRTLGIDAGLRSGWQAMAGAYAGTKIAGAGATMAGKGAGKVVKAGGKTAGSAGAGGVGMYKGMRDGKRNGNVKPVPPHDSNKGTSQNKQQFSTNAVNNPNALRGNSTPVNGSSTIPTKPSSHGTNTRTDPHASTTSINTSNATNATKSSAGKTSITPNQSKPAVNTGRQGHIHPQRKHTLLGGNRTAQRAGHFLSRAHNTGYDMGQKMNQF